MRKTILLLLSAVLLTAASHLSAKPKATHPFGPNVFIMHPSSENGGAFFSFGYPPGDGRVSVENSLG